MCLSYDRHCCPVDHLDGRVSGPYGLDILVQVVASEYYVGAQVFNYLEMDALGATSQSHHDRRRSAHAHASVARIADVVSPVIGLHGPQYCGW